MTRGTRYPVGEYYKNYRCVRSQDYENPNSEWNSVELFSIGSNAIHVVNGKVVNVIEDGHLVVDGKMFPINKGKLQLQSEAAEIFYKDIQIRSISEYPTEIRLAAGLD